MQKNPNITAAASPDTYASSLTRIRPLKGWAHINLRDIWAYRDLLRLLTCRDIKVRYKQTILGAGWAILQPLLTMLVFSLFFGRLAKVPSDGLPYPIFSFAALVPWHFFSGALSQSSSSLVSNAGMIKKVYFPRLVIPLSCTFAALVDMAIAFFVLLIFMVGYGIVPTWNVFWIPALVLLAMVTALGAGLWLSALSVRYRDVRYILPFILQFWLFATPIAYPSSLLKQPWHTLYGLNPMAGVVEGFRWALLGTDTAPGFMIAVSAMAAFLFLLSGVFYFRRMEATFADII